MLKGVQNSMTIKKAPKYALELLNNYGYEAYLVGGCVRDYAMGIEPYDYDICTNALPQQIISVFSAFKTIETGIKHGTVTVIIDNTTIEITTYRNDGEYTKHRSPAQVEFVRDLKSDLSRRDFTINSICCDKDENIVDAFGGINDIENGVIKAIGDARKRFEEDALRILRCIRFSSTLGFSIETETENALFDKKHLLDFVSAERKLTELKKLLLGKNVTEVLLKYRDIIATIIPEITASFDYEQNSLHHCYNVWEHICRTVGNIEPDINLRLAMLLHDIGKPYCMSIGKNGRCHFFGHMTKSAELAKTSLLRLKCDNDTTELVCTLVSQHDNRIKSDTASVRRFISKFGNGFFEMYIKVRLADISAQADYMREEKYSDIRLIEKIGTEIKEHDDCVFLSQLAINGDDVIKLGLKGKAIGECLSDCLEAVISNKIGNDKTILKKYIKERLQKYGD